MINFAAILPELILIVGAIVLLMIGAYVKNSAKIIDFGRVLIFISALIALMLNDFNGTTFNGSYAVDSFAKYMKVLTLLGALVTSSYTNDFFKREGISAFEIPVLMILSTVGMFVLISAKDLITLYLGLELMSLALYVLASIHRDNVKATEAGLKYFVLGALSSGMLLYGSSLLYGFSGSMTFQGIAAASKSGVNLGMIFGIVFVLAGIAFKISAVPFHMWTPDVYEGAPTPITAFFATAPKMAAMALFLRFTIQALPNALHDWQQIVVFISIASMALGAFAAIGQSNIKRLLAYSSIANMGFALVGLAAGTVTGVQGVLIFMAIYLVTTLGTFAIVLSMRTKDGMVENIEDLAGLSKSNPVMALALMVFMFSMIGVPPLAGFFAKFYVFNAAVQQGLWLLAVLGVIASVVGCYYYLRIIKIMYFDEPKAEFVASEGYLKINYIAAMAFLFLFIAFSHYVTEPAMKAAKSLF